MVLVVENDCGCNDRLLCEARVHDKQLELRVWKDPMRMPMCNDCFPMVMAVCDVPPLPAGTIPVVVNGARAFEMTVDASGTCWEVR
jgi:hypothetical protein